MNWTEQQLAEFNAKKNNNATPKPKRKKYGNKITTCDGMRFDSIKEANYYAELKLLHRTGEIKGFCRQPRFPLLGCEYVADFIVWHNDSSVEVVDVKSVATAENTTYRVKIKMFRELYPDIKFTEAR